MASMQRKLGIKRSCHCEDLPSITKRVSAVELNRHDRVGDDAWRPKRRRAMSATSHYAAFSFRGEDKGRSTPWSPKARLISPATSQATVTPLTTPASPSRDAPRFPSLGGDCLATAALPATAALERFMRKESHGPQSLNDLDCGLPTSFEEEEENAGGSHPWPEFEFQDQVDPTSPCRIEDFPWPRRRVSAAPWPPTASLLALTEGAQRPQESSTRQPLLSSTVFPKTASLHQITEALSKL